MEGDSWDGRQKERKGKRTVEKLKEQKEWEKKKRKTRTEGESQNE